MPRPIAHGAVTCVEIDGELIHHVDGVFHGKADLVAEVHASLGKRAERLSPRGALIPCSLDDDLGIAAALISASPGRAVLVKAPVTVWEHIEEEINYVP